MCNPTRLIGSKVWDRMAHSGESAVFGRRNEPHTIIIARGNQVRHFTVRPWLALAAASALVAVTIGYLLATTYLVLRDDLISAATARQARVQQAYEDRISALRAQVDRITSRQLLDQQLMESKVADLLDRQAKLTSRHGRLTPLLEKAESAAKDLPDAAPLPQDKPSERAQISGKNPLLMGLAPVSASAADAPGPLSFWSGSIRGAEPQSPADRADRLFVAINQSLRSIENEQISRIETLADNAYQAAAEITDALAAAGLTIDSDDEGKDTGGPLVAIDDSLQFDAKVRELDQALDHLDAIREEARQLPIANPAPGRGISSTFGVRKDPLLGTPAMHAGMDFRAPAGASARSAGAGTVAKAGWNGGYGRMVEVDHGGGFTTRYAHLSRITVQEGQHVEAGEIVGEVGTTGRSTGPHLHYEVRRNGDALDPLRLLKIGKKIDKYL